MSNPFSFHEISGWGRFPSLSCKIFRPERDRDLIGLEGLLPRGLGRSYGDASLDASKGVVSTLRLNRMLNFDDQTGELEAEGGLSLGDIGQVFLPKGWFLPVTPGTKHVTLGGAIAGDVHGKNHHIDGSISRHITGFELLLPTGERVQCSREQHRDIFEATIGGMGLTGLITRASLKMRKIPGPWLRVRHKPARDLEAVFGLLAEENEEPYSVAWIDCLAKDKSLGRSVLMLGDHIEAPRPAVNLKCKPLISVPFDMPSCLLSSPTLKLFNEVFYRRQASRTRFFISDPDAFFYPLDSVGKWNRMYGRKGFIQYQCVLPEASAFTCIQKLLEHISKAGAASFLAVLKKMGGASEGMLAFPTLGYTLALDIPYRGETTKQLVQALDKEVLKGNGRINLCKDALLAPDAFRAMYPRLQEWQEVKRKIDPNGLLQSELSRRLKLMEVD